MKGFILFALGAVIGSGVTYYLVREKCERAAQEEIDSVKEAFERLEEQKEKTKELSDKVHEIAEKAREKASVAEYAKQLKDQGYTYYSNVEKPKEEDQPEPEQKRYFGSKDATPYVIPPEQFGEFDDYDKISLTFYADKILADDNDEILEDVEGVVGFESLTHFGEYEDDSVYVRNDRLKCDYEILLSQRDYSDVIKSKPYLKRDE